MLAARRFTSHSHGPGSVSSKSLMSNSSLPLGRAEEAEVRQVRVAAELHVDPGARRRRQVGRHDQRRAAVERERRDEHPSVADRDELGHAALGLLLEQARSGRAGRRPAPTCRAPTSAPGPRASPTARDPLVGGEVHVSPCPRVPRRLTGVRHSPVELCTRVAAELHPIRMTAGASPRILCNTEPSRCRTTTLRRCPASSTSRS